MLSSSHGLKGLTIIIYKENKIKVPDKQTQIDPALLCFVRRPLDGAQQYLSVHLSSWLPWHYRLCTAWVDSGLVGDRQSLMGSVGAPLLGTFRSSERKRSCAARSSAAVLQPQRQQARKEKQTKLQLERWRSIKGLLSSTVHWGVLNGLEGCREQVSAPMERKLHPKHHPFLEMLEFS